MLAARGVGPGSLVGVCLPRGADLPVALLAVARTGAAYVPIDVSHPAERIGYVLADAGVRLVVTHTSQLDWLSTVYSGELLVLDRERAGIEAAPVAATYPAAADELAYVIYTSGSTGRPKGVAVTRGGLANLLLAMVDLGLSGGVWLASTSVSFDISGLELYLPLVTGGSLVLATEDQAKDPAAQLDLVARHGITHVQATPSGWRLLLDAGLRATGLTALVGGEALPTEVARALRGEVARLINVYGPTETTIWSSAWEVPDHPAAIRVGGPLRRTGLYVLDRTARAVPVGVVGELYIGGAGLARGYAGRPELTAGRFIPDPSGTGARLYRTGDLARVTLDGEIEVLGRVDFQVKLRGYRIELGEIESALRTHPGVKDAAVVAREEPGGDAWLAAYVIPVAGATPEAAGLREHLAASLPEYMVPAAFVRMAAWPLSGAGKLDRTALPVPDRESRAVAREYVAPRTPLEERLAGLWREVLNVPRVGVRDSFFDLGGDSIRVIALVGALRQHGYQISARDVFEGRTIARIAELLGEGGEAAPATAAPFTLIERADRELLPDGVVDAYPLSQVQTGMLVEALLDEQVTRYHNVATFRITDGHPFRLAALQGAIDEVVRRHEVLRTGMDMTTYSVPMQLVYAEAGTAVAVHEPEPARLDAVLREVTAAEAARPFDPARPPLIRASAVVESGSAWWLALTHSHTILEGWSHYSLLGEVLGIYQALRDGAPVPAADRPEVRFADFVAAEREALDSAETRGFWAGIVAGHEVFTLPSAWSGDPAGPREEYSVKVPLHGLADRLRELGRAADASLKAVLLAAHLRVLAMLTPEPRFLAGLVTDGRPELAGADRVYGMYLNTLPFPVERTARTWRELVRQTFARELDVWPHRRFPLPEMQRQAGGRRLVEVLFNYLDFHQVDTDVVDVEASLGAGTTEFGLVVTTLGGNLSLWTNTHTLSRAYGDVLATLYRRVLDAMVADPDADPWADLVGGSGVASLLPARRPATEGYLLHERFAARAAATPD
ncbi:MAG TPA: amino acid adenylation domain-containing protein, partial [Rugosimonospora sp.]|nr:amino acid adenylation domain-containing protein [Rugosimonospora sp.]